MSKHRLDRILRKAVRHRSAELPRAEHQEELGSNLRSDFRSRNPRRGRWSPLDPWRQPARYAFLSVFLIMFGLGACTTSTTVELEMGKKVSVVLTNPDQPDVEIVKAELLAFLESQPDVENVSVSCGYNGDNQIFISALVWGLDTSSVLTQETFRHEVPILAEADIQIEALKGIMKETYATNWTRKLFRLEVDGKTEEEIRAQIMAQLANQGVADGVTVDIDKENGRTGITITVEE